jgi:hypothetical protein
MPLSALARNATRKLSKLRNASRITGDFLRSTRIAYADMVSDYVTTRVRTRGGRIGLALAILAIALATGFHILGSAFTEDQPLMRVAAVWGAALWLFGFGHSAAIVLRPALQRDRG